MSDTNEKEWWSEKIDRLGTWQWEPKELRRFVAPIIAEAERRKAKEIREEIKRMLTNHEKKKKNPDHEKDEFWGCCECWEDKHYNTALNVVINLLKKMK